MIALLALLLPLSSSAFDELVLHDRSRGREIPTRVYRAQGPAPHAVLVFSPGTGAPNSVLPYLGQYLAAHGVIVVVPAHDDGRSRRQLDRSSLDPKHWLSRVQDIRFVIDSLAKLASDADPTRVAVAGHSFGALTAMLLAGAKPKVPPKGSAPAYVEPRIKAFIPISPQGEGDVFAADSWDTIRPPLLYITGSNDNGWRDQAKGWRLQPYEHSRGPEVYLLYFEGAFHGTFADPLRGETRLQAVHDLLPPTILSFLRAYLDQDAAAKRELVESELAAKTGGKVVLRHK